MTNRSGVVILAFTIAALVMSRFLISPVNVATDLHTTFDADLIAQVSMPSTWGERGAVGLGEYSVFILWNWPVNLLFGIIANLGFSFSLLIKSFGFLLPIFLSVFSINKLLDHLKIGPQGRLVGSILYVLNTYSVLLIGGGQLNLFLAYSVFPFALYIFLKSRSEGSFKKFVKAAMLVVLISIFDIRAVYLFGTLSSIIFVFILATQSHRLAAISWFTKFWITSSTLLLGFHFYWILPSILAQAPSLPDTFDRASQLDFLGFGNYKHPILLLQPHWYRNVFGKIDPIRKEFLILPMLVFAAPLLRRSKMTILWVFVALVGVFLAKGSLWPFGTIYEFLFLNLPGFNLFRDSTKFFFIVALAYSVLAAMSIDALNKKIVTLFALGAILVLMKPAWDGRLSGTFAPPRYIENYQDIEASLLADKEFGRVFWIPTKSPIGYSSPLHPSVEASRLAGMRPFAAGVIGTYETFNFLREASYMGEIFNVLGVKYIAYPFPDVHREKLKDDNVIYYNNFSDQILKQNWINQEISSFPVRVFETKTPQQKLFIAANTFAVVGSDNIYEFFFGEAKLSENALVFVEEKLGSIDQIVDKQEARIILNNKSTTDLAASLIDQDSYIFPAAQLGFEPDEAGWWKRETSDFISWKSFLQNKYSVDYQDFDYGGGLAIAEGEMEIVIDVPDQFQKSVVLVRAMESTRGGAIEIYQGETLIGGFDTLMVEGDVVVRQITGNSEIADQIFEYTRAPLKWQEVGDVSSNEPLTIKTNGDINVVNALAIVEQNEWETAQILANELIDSDRVVLWHKLDDTSKNELMKSVSRASVTYTMLSPTEYVVSVAGIENLSTLVFSDTFNNEWRLDGQEPLQVYSMVNGYTISNNGEYGLYFSPQKYVLPGLIITFSTLLASVFILYKKS